MDWQIRVDMIVAGFTVVVATITVLFVALPFLDGQVMELVYGLIILARFVATIVVTIAAWHCMVDLVLRLIMVVTMVTAMVSFMAWF